jgi:hypothetical protein
VYEKQPVDITNPEKITRIEVIGQEGREYVRYLKEDEVTGIALQDDGRTLKVFINRNEK